MSDMRLRGADEKLLNARCVRAPTVQSAQAMWPSSPKNLVEILDKHAHDLFFTKIFVRNQSREHTQTGERHTSYSPVCFSSSISQNSPTLISHFCCSAVYETKTGRGTTSCRLCSRIESVYSVLTAASSVIRCL